jgi:hypothetical protein
MEQQRHMKLASNADVPCVVRQSAHSVVVKQQGLVSEDEDGEECWGLTRSHDTDHDRRMLDSGIDSLEEFLVSKWHTVAQIFGASRLCKCHSTIIDECFARRSWSY